MLKVPRVRVWGNPNPNPDPNPDYDPNSDPDPDPDPNPRPNPNPKPSLAIPIFLKIQKRGSASHIFSNYAANNAEKKMPCNK